MPSLWEPEPHELLPGPAGNPPPFPKDFNYVSQHGFTFKSLPSQYQNRPQRRLMQKEAFPVPDGVGVEEWTNAFNNADTKFYHLGSLNYSKAMRTETYRTRRAAEDIVIKQRAIKWASQLPFTPPAIRIPQTFSQPDSSPQSTSPHQTSPQPISPRRISPVSVASTTTLRLTPPTTARAAAYFPTSLTIADRLSYSAPSQSEMSLRKAKQSGHDQDPEFVPAVCRASGKTVDRSRISSSYASRSDYNTSTTQNSPAPSTTTATTTNGTSRRKRGRRPKAKKKSKTSADDDNNHEAASDANDDDSDDDPDDDDDEQDGDDEDDNTLYCICRKPDDHSSMIACTKCHEWYHVKCLDKARKERGDPSVETWPLKKTWKLVDIFHCIECNTNETTVMYMNYLPKCGIDKCYLPARLGEEYAEPSQSNFCTDDHAKVYYQKIVDNLVTNSTGHPQPGQLTTGTTKTMVVHAYANGDGQALSRFLSIGNDPPALEGPGTAEQRRNKMLAELEHAAFASGGVSSDFTDLGKELNRHVTPIIHEDVQGFEWAPLLNEEERRTIQEDTVKILNQEDRIVALKFQLRILELANNRTPIVEKEYLVSDQYVPNERSKAPKICGWDFRTKMDVNELLEWLRSGEGQSLLHEHNLGSLEMEKGAILPEPRFSPVQDQNTLPTYKGACVVFKGHRPKPGCSRHSDWYEVQRDDLRMEISECRKQIKVSVAKRDDIWKRAEIKAATPDDPKRSSSRLEYDKFGSQTIAREGNRRPSPAHATTLTFNQVSIEQLAGEARSRYAQLAKHMKEQTEARDAAQNGLDEVTHDDPEGQLRAEYANSRILPGEDQEMYEDSPRYTPYSHGEHTKADRAAAWDNFELREDDDDDGQPYIADDEQEEELHPDAMTLD